MTIERDVRVSRRARHDEQRAVVDAVRTGATRGTAGEVQERDRARDARRGAVRLVRQDRRFTETLRPCCVLLKSRFTEVLLG